MQTIEERENDIRELRKEIACADDEQRAWLQMDLAAVRRKLNAMKASTEARKS